MVRSIASLFLPVWAVWTKNVTNLTAKEQLANVSRSLGWTTCWERKLLSKLLVREKSWWETVNETLTKLKPSTNLHSVTVYPPNLSFVAVHAFFTPKLEDFILSLSSPSFTWLHFHIWLSKSEPHSHHSHSFTFILSLLVFFLRQKSQTEVKESYKRKNNINNWQNEFSYSEFPSQGRQCDSFWPVNSS